MIGLLAMLGIGLILWWVSKGLNKLSVWLTVLSGTTADMISIQCKAKSNKTILQQNKIAEAQLQNIKGESSYVAYQHTVRNEIEEIIKSINV
jgi:hypothetical protein